MLRKRTISKITLPALVLLGALAIAGYLKATKPTLEPTAPVEKTWLIAANPISISDHQPEILAYGKIVSQRDTEMRTLVAGQVVVVGTRFVDGGYVNQGDLLIKIDPFQFDVAVAKYEAQVMEAEAQLDEIQAQFQAEAENLKYDKKQLEISKREWQRRVKLAKGNVISKKVLDDTELALNERSRAVSLGKNNLRKLLAIKKKQTAIISQAETSLSKARRDLENVELTAPFSGYLSQIDTAIGKSLPVNGKVGRLIDLDRLEVKFHLSNAEFGHLAKSWDTLVDRSVRIIWRVGSQKLEFFGSVTRVSSQIDASSGGIQVYATVDNSDSRSALRSGAFVEVYLLDQIYKQVARLPESALHDNKTIYIVVNNRLEERPVKLIKRIGNEVLLHGELSHGEMAVTTRFPGIGPGIKVSIR